MITQLALIALAFLLPPVLHDVVRRPTIRRLGVRNVVRRRSEAALVIGGSMLATALIAASFIVGSSFDTSIRNIATARLGPVDEIVFVDQPERIDDLGAAILAAAPTEIDGVLEVISATVAVGSVTDDPADRRVESQASLLEMSLAEASAFGGDPESTGFAGVTQGPPGTAVINSDLADEIGVDAGDAIDLFFGADPIRLTVHEVVEATGMAGFADIVVPPGSAAAALAVFDPAEIQGIAPAALVVSNAGGVFEGADRSDAVMAVIESEAERLGIDASPNDTKADLLRDAESEGSEMTELFGTVGGFSVIAGILLVVNLFVMLASERTVELGTMRAVGLQRGTILRSFLLEGAVYGIAAALIGALLGVAVAAGVIAFASRLFDSDGFEVTLALERWDLAAGAAIGLAISQLTVLFTSARITRINIVRALKDLPPQPAQRAAWRRAAISLLGMAAGALLFVGLPDQPVAAMAGPVVVAVAAIGLLGLAMPRKLATVLCCGAAVVWPVLVFTARRDAMDGADIEVFLLQGVLLVGLATALLASLDRVWLRGVDLLSPSGVGARLGLAHPLARPVRSALLVAMYSLVIFTVTFMAVLNAAFLASAPRLANEAGGQFSFVVDANRTAPLSREQLLEVDGVIDASAVRRGYVETGELDDPDGWGVSTVDATWRADLAPPLDEVASEFGDGGQAWAAVVEGGWIVVPDWSDFEPGEAVTLRSPSGATADVRVAGLSRNNWLVGANMFIADGLSDELWDNQRPVTRHYVVADPERAQDVSDEVQGRWPEQGAATATFAERAEDELRAQEGFLQMLQGYLGLGLLIGIAGLGVVLVRAVRERRRELGMLAAIGVPVEQTQRAFLVEATFIGVQGVVLGITLGLVSAWQVLTRTAAFEEGLPFEVPVLFLAGLTVVAVAASIGAAIVPARRAARIPPAVALRITG